MTRTKFNTIGLVVRQDIYRHIDTARLVIAALERYGDVLVHSLDADFPISEIETVSITKLVEQCDLVISLGGDGTLLAAARALLDRDTPLLGINLGRLGFLADVSVSDFEQHLIEIIAGHYTIEKRFFIEGQIDGPSRVTSNSIAINDIILHSYESSSMIEFEVYSDGILIHKQRANGVIVATPTGSTAYALSGGGPIMHPSLQALAIVPICPHTLSNRPIVLPASQQIEIRLSEPESTAQINYDGQSTVIIGSEDRVQIRRHPHPVHLLHPENYDYFEILRAKLYWSTNY